MTYPFPFLSPTSTYTPGTLSATAQALSTTNSTTHTFTNQDIGSASSSRLVIVVVDSVSSINGTPRYITSATIGGIDATIGPIATGNNGNALASQIIYASVPTGTTATIVVNHNALAHGIAIQVYRAEPQNITPFYENSENAGGAVYSSRSIAVNVKSGGFSIMGACTSGNAMVASSNGSDAITEDMDRFNTGWNGQYGAFSALTSEDGGITWTITPSNTGQIIMVVASWL